MKLKELRLLGCMEVLYPTAEEFNVPVNLIGDILDSIYEQAGAPTGDPSDKDFPEVLTNLHDNTITEALKCRMIEKRNNGGGYILTDLGEKVFKKAAEHQYQNDNDKFRGYLRFYR